MKRLLVMLGCLAASSAGAWGQAAAEYGLTASKSAAGAAAAANRLSKQTSAVISSATNLERPVAASGRSAAPVRSARRPTSPSNRQAGSAAETTPIPVPEAASQHESLTLSIQGGTSGKGYTEASKYPSAVQITGSNSPPAKKK